MRNTCFSSIILPASHISISSSSNQTWFDSYKLIVFIGVKGAWSGEGEVEGESEVIKVGGLLIVSWFPFVWVSGLLPPSDIIPHGEEAWWVIFHMFNFQIVGPIKCTICMKNNNFSPFYILCLTVLRDVQGVTKWVLGFVENPREVQRRKKSLLASLWAQILQTDISPLCGGHLCWVGVPPPNAYSIYGGFVGKLDGSRRGVSSIGEVVMQDQIHVMRTTRIDHPGIASWQPCSSSPSIQDHCS